jgi:hypothetical protein
MSPLDQDSTYPSCRLATRVVEVGGRTGAELLDDLRQAGVELNESGLVLLESEWLRERTERRSLFTVELTVRQLGFPVGGRMSEIFRRAAELGLSLCPLELGPYFRLQYLDQPEGYWGFPVTKHRAPPGSITIASQPVTDDDKFPKGFYLRRIQGVLWLRGYVSDDLHVYDPDDHLAFCKL